MSGNRRTFRQTDGEQIPGLKVLAAGPGERVLGSDSMVTEAMHQSTLDYFTERQRHVEGRASRVPADGPETSRSSSIELHHVYRPKGSPAEAGVLALRNEYPAPLLVDGVRYPTVAHAYWALSTTDPEQRAAIRAAEDIFVARRAAEQAPRRPGWEQGRTAVMARLLRAKFAQHPELAPVLTATGDAALRYTDADSPQFWGQSGAQGRNWMGRLLELVRAELAADAHGLTDGALVD
ncbi:NADAR family protein [Kitasatospora azatica]|uniref:NADAR family protein n=1 Tax=Kitasatospora azatica TaxID=58347 RepID=UPI00069162D8|nr:NADAR family protein [Kitasatospora azatica]